MKTGVGRSRFQSHYRLESKARASDEADFESAARVRDRFEALEWLVAAGSRIRAAIDAVSFVYVGPETGGGALSPDAIDEMVLLLSWFRRHPAALRRTTPLERWLERESAA